MPRSLRTRIAERLSRIEAARSSVWIERRLVWLLGSPRSGSTWLLQLLAEHPAVVPINEPLIGWYLGPFLSDLPGFDSSSLQQDNFTLRKVQGRNRNQFFADEFDNVVTPALGELLRKRFLAHGQRYPAQAPLRDSKIVIKEPSGSQSADLILPALPTSGLLFLLRDGRDVVDSELAANLKGSWVSSEFPGATGLDESQRIDFVERSAQKWLWRTEIVEAAFARHEGRKLLVRYEDLLSDTARHLAAIFNWMELPLPMDQLAVILEKHSFESLPR